MDKNKLTNAILTGIYILLSLFGFFHVNGNRDIAGGNKSADYHLDIHL